MMETRVLACVLKGSAGAGRRVPQQGAMLRCSVRALSSGSEERCRLLVVGGGTGGCALAAKYARSMAPGEVVVLEPATMHYYQPMFTLVGGGLKSLSASGRPMEQVLPKRARWVRDAAATFHPDENLVETQASRRLRYDFLIVAMGLELRFQDIPGLEEALSTPSAGVCSNYSPKHVEKTWQNLQKLKEGDAYFTFPNTPIKCAGAPQKIVYLSDDYLRRMGRRDAVRIHYHTSLGALFGVKHYSDALWPIARERNIDVKLRSELVEVRPDKHEAVFRNLDAPEERTTVPYSMLHVTPPQGPPATIKACTQLADPATGYLSVHKQTLQHTRYPNVFGVGDCTNLPTSKTAAAAAAQTAVLRRMLNAALAGKPLPQQPAYDGYTSCPLVTGKGKCVLAEFDYDGQPLETFPIDQRQERWTMYQVKATFMPILYWHLMLKGLWEGPGIMRKALHLGFGR